MRNPPDFSRHNPPFFPLSIPAPALLERVVTYCDSAVECEESKTLLDLLQALAFGNDFNLPDLILLDREGLLLAQGVIHHSLQTGRLNDVVLADAVEQIVEHRLARRLAWQP